MSPLTMLVILIALALLCWALWFLLEFLRYLISGEYRTDQRLRDICK